MNLRRWSKQHTFGILIGILSPIVFIPFILWIISLIQHFPFEQIWYKFNHFDAIKGKFVSLSILPNLAWFYFFLNKEKYDFAMGIILGTLSFLPYIVFLIFF
ncbi:MAG: hypothetical protein HYU67_07530 [Flavobacteriia bacterium]|nr:hypothetical protein [Flavobacteriia bacterium]